MMLRHRISCFITLICISYQKMRMESNTGLEEDSTETVTQKHFCQKGPCPKAEMKVDERKYTLQ